MRRKPARRTYTLEEKLHLVAEITRRYQAGGKTYATIARELGVSDSSYHNWVSQGLKPTVSSPTTKAVERRVYAPAERARLLAEVDRLRAEGRNLDTACRTVGISDTSYRKWKDETAPTPAMRPVEVTALVPTAPAALSFVPPQPAALPAPGALTLVAPSGHRIEGLGLESAAALLKALA